ncbi:aminoglycoside N(3)-acetyltransferase [Streptomyces sp. NPDC004646]
MPKPAPNGPLITRDTISARLREMGVAPGETLLVHSSLSSLGWVNGGPVAVVQGLLDALGPTGTLTVPTHSTHLSDPARWRNPPAPEEWWDAIRATMPVYDPRITPTLGMGAIPETVRTWPGALRSAHPQTSFAALGPRAAEITEGHAPDCRLGEHSPLARLERAGARVLLLGVGYGSCTAFHLAEYRVPSPSARIEWPAPGGGWEEATDGSIDSERFEELGHDFERDRPVVRARIGTAEARLFPLGDAVSYAERWLPVHRPREEEFSDPRA